MRRSTIGAAWLAITVGAAACGGSTSRTSVIGPTGDRCAVALANNTPEIAASGGTGSFEVRAERECSWSASSEASWVVLGAASGVGPSTVNYSVAANPNASPRRGRVVVSQQAIEVVQAAAPCRYEASPSDANVGPSNAQVSISLTAPGGCRWTSRSEVPWLAVEPAEGIGSATIRVSVEANSEQPRVGTVVIGDATVRVTQAGRGATPSPGPPPSAPNCAYTVSPRRLAIAPSGEHAAIDVAASAGCAWTATSRAPWISIISGTTGSGDGAVRIVVPENTSTFRTGTLVIAGHTVTVEQAARTCIVRIQPTTYTAGRGPDDISIDVTADTGCAWAATSAASWVTIASGRSGSGNGTVRLLVQANNGPERTALVNIADQVFTLRQEEGSCTYTIQPRSYHAGRGPDDIRVAVTAPAGCGWTASSSVSWVTVAEGASGSGNASVRLLVQANSGRARATTITIARQPFELRQDGSQ